ncbi:MAG: hypothetical protein AB7N76_17025 [Planctomycetota bacterium]
MRRTGVLALAASMTLALSNAAFAGGIGNLEGVNLGEHWYGPKRDKDELKGRVVMIEEWGFN